MLPGTASSWQPGETTAVRSPLWSTKAERSRHVQPTPGRRGHRVERRVDGTISVDVAADRRRRRTWTSADFWSVSAMYRGAVPLRHRYVKAHNRNWIRSGTRNQCSWRRSGVMCSDFLTENTNWAAAFRTDCNLCSSATGRPASTELQ